MAGHSGSAGGDGATPGAPVALAPAAERMRQRRRRILMAALPRHVPLDPVPGWVITPEHFVDWIAGRLAPAALRFYLNDVEDIARQTCDLELLRLARRHQPRP